MARITKYVGGYASKFFVVGKTPIVVTIKKPKQEANMQCLNRNCKYQWHSRALSSGYSAPKSCPYCQNRRVAVAVVAQGNQ